MNTQTEGIQADHARYQQPDEPVSTPCFVIFEDNVLHNLTRTAQAAGSIERLMPHVKTHRAPWIVKLLMTQGVGAFKCATPAEVEMALGAGATRVTWAYPAVSPANLTRFLSLARTFKDARLTGMVDSAQGLEAWKGQISAEDDNVDIRVDLDAGMGRTGAPISSVALDLAAKVRNIRPFRGMACLRRSHQRRSRRTPATGRQHRRGRIRFAGVVARGWRGIRRRGRRQLYVQSVAA